MVMALNLKQCVWCYTSLTKTFTFWCRPWHFCQQISLKKIITNPLTQGLKTIVCTKLSCTICLSLWLHNQSHGRSTQWNLATILVFVLPFTYSLRSALSGLLVPWVVLTPHGCYCCHCHHHHHHHHHLFYSCVSLWSVTASFWSHGCASCYLIEDALKDDSGKI